MGFLKKAEDGDPRILGDLMDELVSEMLEVGKYPEWGGHVWNFNIPLDRWLYPRAGKHVSICINKTKINCLDLIALLEIWTSNIGHLKGH